MLNPVGAMRLPERTLNSLAGVPTARNNKRRVRTTFKVIIPRLVKNRKKYLVELPHFRTESFLKLKVLPVMDVSNYDMQITSLRYTSQKGDIKFFAEKQHVI